MSGHGARFARKVRTLAARLTRRNIQEATAAVKISIKTLLGWRKLPEFKKAYMETRAERLPRERLRSM